MSRFGFSVSSGILSGSGSLDLSDVFSFVVSPPTNGAVLIRFTLSAYVAGFNDDLIWNQESATLAQFRGGRIVLCNADRPQFEFFVDRRWNTIERCIYLETDPNGSEEGIAGTGEYQIDEYLGTHNRILTQTVKYGLEPGVLCQIFAFGEYYLYVNPENKFTFRFQPRPFLS